MSTLADQRAAILAALRTVPALTVYDSKPGVLKEGTTYVRWAGTGGGDGSGPAWWFDRWYVYIVLYGDDRVLERWTDAHVQDVADALDRVAPLQAIEPVDLIIEIGSPATVPALRITCSRE